MANKVLKFIALTILIILYFLLASLVFDYIIFWRYYPPLIYFLITLAGNVFISLIKINKKIKIPLWIILNFSLVFYNIIETIIYLINNDVEDYRFIDFILYIIPSLLVPNWFLPGIIMLVKSLLKKSNSDNKKK
jgi:hypothetical protein